VKDRHGTHGGQDGGASRHVVLHAIHPVGRLDGDASRIERDPFSDQAENRSTRRFRWFVAQHDHARRLRARLRDAQQ
jgi:hypothetical protein